MEINLYLLLSLLIALLVISYLLGKLHRVRGQLDVYKRQSYASEDTDLLGVDEDYTALENELAQTVANIESTHQVRILRGVGGAG